MSKQQNMPGLSAETRKYLDAMVVVDIARPRREDGEQAAHLARVMTRAGHSCAGWTPAIVPRLAFEVTESAAVDSLLKRMFLAIRRAPVLFNIKSLELQLQSQNTVMQQTTDTDLLMEIAAARRETKLDLVRARQKYSSLLPVGVVKVWSAA